MNSNDGKKTDDPLKQGVKIVHTANKLKKKVSDGLLVDGPGSFNPTSIKNAQAIIDNSQSSYLKAIEAMLLQLEQQWEKTRKLSKKEAKEDLKQFYRIANRVKEMSSTYGYDLMASFGESLSDFAKKINPEHKAHHTIVQAHVNVMKIAFHEKIKGDDSQKAEELKKALAQATEKYG